MLIIPKRNRNKKFVDRGSHMPPRPEISNENNKENNTEEIVEEIVEVEEVIEQTVIEIPIESEYYIVVDFEATCFKGRQVPRNETEIIEFAAVMVNKETLLPTDEFSMFVRPVIHPKLDNFCIDLTTITQEDIDNALPFNTVYHQFVNWLEQYPGPKTFCSWGEYDKKQLYMECDRNNLNYPFDENHLNVKKLFSRKKNYRRQYGLGGALKQLKMNFEGTHHRGIDDSRNIARIMREILTEPF